eukprot:9104419-Pyramimonas_sp.AAC.1
MASHSRRSPRLDIRGSRPRTGSNWEARGGPCLPWRGWLNHRRSCSSQSSGIPRPASGACCPRMLGGDRGRGRVPGARC